ncbi:MAG TPA: tRNA epoxyqueuosine(34) reductase QueG [Ignavibacteriaceae bacterium]|nr:tRNA epoxyqueuosine(34) reductase QueG [Ignavibacteriaceae bacterium]
MSITNEIVINLAKEYGFNLVGFAKADILVDEINHLKEWLAKGYHASMGYMERNIEKKQDVKNILPSAVSVISLGINYYNDVNYSDETDKGKISRYALSYDYHNVIEDKLKLMMQELKEIDETFEYKYYVDSGPTMDKAWAVKSGLGWLSKNTNVINPEIGSWFFITNIITNKKFNYNNIITDHCGTCTACIDACPTEAITPYQVNANRCISFLTIENKGDISEEFSGKMNNWIFGCDICQEVCPWNNKFSVVSKTKDFFSTENEIDLQSVMNMGQKEFSAKYKNSPIKRSKLKGLQRNAEFVLKRS